MPHQNTVFHALVKRVPRGQFQRLVREHKSDHRVRRLSSWTQFVALLYGQLAEIGSLRGLEAVLNSHGNRLYHLGGETVHRSSLSDANSNRPPELFEGLLAAMLPDLSHEAAEAHSFLRLIDATVMQLNGRAAWARYRDSGSAVKAHVVYDPHAQVPTYFTITPAKTNDMVEAKKLAIEPGATYVFDGGYYSFDWWAKLNEAQCRFVTRLKKNSPLTLVEERPVFADTIMSDRVVTLSKRLARSRRNPYAEPVREVVVLIDKGRSLRLVTNDLIAPAYEIANLYKTRWQIELFFKWIKQNLRLKSFYGTSLGAVRIQVAVALIAYLLVHGANGKSVHGMQTTLRLVRANLMHRKHIAQLAKPPDKKPSHNLDQMTFNASWI